jgi:hypothetical protein
MMGGAEELPSIQDAIDRLDEMLNEPFRPSDADYQKERLRQAIGLPARPMGS